MKRLLLLPTLAALLLLSACHPFHHEPGYAGGPPAHAPAHGYRKKHGSHDLSYDSGLGVYVVVGSPSYYYWNDFYWRLRDGIWIQASAFDGPWIVVQNTQQKLPPGLAKKHGYGKGSDNSANGQQGKSQDKDKDKDKDKAKGKDKNKNK